MNILFLPIDIDLSDFKFEQKSHSQKAGSFMQYWDATFIENDVLNDTGLTSIIDHLPFTKITRLFHKIQTTDVPKHVDVHTNMIMEPGEYEHIKEMEPAGYRIVLKGQKDSLSVYNGNIWINVELPSVPCCYLLNSTTGYHKLKNDPGRETIYLRGYLDENRHKDLIERSLLKYKDYVVYDESV